MLMPCSYCQIFPNGLRNDESPTDSQQNVLLSCDAFLKFRQVVIPVSSYCQCWIVSAVEGHYITQKGWSMWLNKPDCYAFIQRTNLKQDGRMWTDALSHHTGETGASCRRGHWPKALEPKGWKSPGSIWTTRPRELEEGLIVMKDWCGW